MKNNKLYTICVTVLITAVLCLMTSSAYYNGKLLIKPGADAKLNVITNLLDDNYFGTYNKDKANDAAVKAYVKAVGDPYTEYMNKADLEKFSSFINSEYCGIGVTVQYNAEDNTILVVGVFDNSPADEAGIVEGDIITKVNDVPYSGEQLNEATTAIQGEEGTEVTVTVKKTDGKEKDLTMTRRSIHVDSVESEVLEDNIGYIAILQFSSTASAEFKTHFDELVSKGVKGLVVDVRDNTGGTTEAVESIASTFLKKGDIIYYTSDKHGKKMYAKCSKDGNLDLPLVVLSNGNSASASEILIASVKENDRGVIVGEKSYGKGVVQNLFQMNDGTAIKVTVEKYFTPDGNDIHKKGIEPDYEVVLTENDTTDTQLAKAIELLK